MKTIADDQIRSDWESLGYCYFPGFMSAEHIRRYREICDHVMELWFEERGGRDKIAKTISMQYLTEPRYFKNDRRALIELLELIASERILQILSMISDEVPLFHNTQYFFEQPTTEWTGVWHRDTQFETPDPEQEKQRIAHSTGLHFRIAFTDDTWLEFVPGSHNRWDTPEELAVRLSPHLARRSQADIPGKVTMQLKQGDALLFSSWGIHRGTYRTTPIRRTLDMVYHLGPPCEYISPPPTCFQDADLFKQLSSGAQSFFSRFVSAHANAWGNPRQNWIPTAQRVRIRYDFSDPHHGPQYIVSELD